MLTNLRHVQLGIDDGIAVSRIFLGAGAPLRNDVTDR